MAEDDADAGAVEGSGLRAGEGVAAGGEQQVDDRVELREEVAVNGEAGGVEGEAFDETGAVGVNAVGRAGRGVEDVGGVEPPTAGGHGAAGVAAGGDDLPELIERARAGEDAAHADDGDGFAELHAGRLFLRKASRRFASTTNS